MTTHKRKKIIKYRGSKSCGGGSMKKRRGAGNRGGRGLAGTGKRCDAKKPLIWSNKKYFGKYGFKSKKTKEDIKAINIGYINEKIGGFANRGIASEKGGAYEIDISRIGFSKLLGSGNISKKITIHAKYAAPRAVEKAKKAGGDVILTAKQEKAEEKEE